MTEVMRELKEYCIDFRENEPLKSHSTFGIGGPARLFVLPKTEDEIVGALRIFKKNKVGYFILGNGSNMLFDDSGFKGAVTATSLLDGKKIAGKKIEAGCGVKCSALSEYALEADLSGLEFLYGLPGNVGGALFMNAGAFGGLMSDVVESVTFYDAENDRISKTGAREARFSYRHSIFAENRSLLILSAVFMLKKSDKASIRAAMDANLKRRRESQPRLPSAGSVFKRHGDVSVAKLIDECGLKGYHVNDAEISVKHAGFIVNKGNAKSKDVLQLISQIQNIIQSRYNFIPECEVIYLSDGEQTQGTLRQG